MYSPLNVGTRTAKLDSELAAVNLEAGAKSWLV